MIGPQMKGSCPVLATRHAGDGDGETGEAEGEGEGRQRWTPTRPDHPTYRRSEPMNSARASSLTPKLVCG
jgi:hypothetical protein